MLRAYDEIVDFIAEGTSPGKVVAFRPSETTKARVEDLIGREKTTGLSSDETAELNQYLQLEHLMRLAKARALGHIKDIGMATAKILDFNNAERLLERQTLQAIGCYPSIADLKAKAEALDSSY